MDLLLLESNGGVEYCHVDIRGQFGVIWLVSGTNHAPGYWCVQPDCHGAKRAALLTFPLSSLELLPSVLLTDMAYLYSIQSHMPTLRYLTLLDYWVFGNVFFVFAVLIEVTILEMTNLNMEQEQFDTGVKLRTVVLLFNLATWAMLVFTFVVVAVRARRMELRKLESPPKEDDWMLGDHEAFECNMFCGGSEMTLMLG